MTLPINNTITYNLVVPSTKKEIKFRPFVVKEQKELMISHQSEDINVMVDTLKSVIKSCVKTPVDVEKLSIFDLEYIFVNIRAKSVGEVSELLFGCNTAGCEDNPKAKVKIGIDLTKIQVETPEGHTNNISLYNDVGVILKYPNIELLKKLEKAETESEIMFEIILDSIDMIYDKDEIYKVENYTTEELSEFLDNLPMDSFNSIINFFTTMPKLTQQVKYTCPVCATTHEYALEGMNSFF